MTDLADKSDVELVIDALRGLKRAGQQLDALEVEAVLTDEADPLRFWLDNVRDTLTALRARYGAEIAVFGAQADSRPVPPEYIALLRDRYRKQ